MDRGSRGGGDWLELRFGRLVAWMYSKHKAMGLLHPYMKLYFCEVNWDHLPVSLSSEGLAAVFFCLFHLPNICKHQSQHREGDTPIVMDIQKISKPQNTDFLLS